ncbi:MAG: winged helix-turn-helix transcriptional regulator, partial [Phocaeicola sp.]
EENNLIERKAYAEIPPRVEYSLTKTGRSFLPILEQMIGWSQENFTQVTGQVS